MEQFWESWGNLQGCRELDPRVQCSHCGCIPHWSGTYAHPSPTHPERSFKSAQAHQVGLEVKAFLCHGSGTGGWFPSKVLLVVVATASPGTGDGESPKCSPSPGGGFWELFKQPGQQTQSFCTCVCTRGIWLSPTDPGAENQSQGELGPCSCSGVS